MITDLHQVKSFLLHYFKASRGGHGVHSPFAYTLSEEVFYNKNPFYDFEELNYIRKTLLKDKTELEVEDFGAGSKKLSARKRRVCDIAAHGISSQRQSEILFRLINFLKSDIMIELGTSLGLNTIYMTRANRNALVFTVEGSKAIGDYASSLMDENRVHTCSLSVGNFDEKLPELLSILSKGEICNTVDLLYVDGNHTYEATMRYFKMALQSRNNNSVFVFDDIYWSAGMTKAWEEIKKHPEVTMSIDTFYTGFVFFKQEIKEKTDLRFYI